MHNRLFLGQFDQNIMQNNAYVLYYSNTTSIVKRKVKCTYLLRKPIKMSGVFQQSNDGAETTLCFLNFIKSLFVSFEIDPYHSKKVQKNWHCTIKTTN